MHNVSAALEGAYDSEVESPGWLAHAEWLLNFSHYSLPTGAGNIKGGHVTAAFLRRDEAFDWWQPEFSLWCALWTAEIVKQKPEV